jgi:glycosyltransferase involved in cell wall biosynthesis
MFLRDNPKWGVGFIGAELGDFARFPSWREDWMGNDDRPKYYATVARGTVGVGPLRNTPFNRAKSGLRAQEFMACGVVPVLPDMRIYRDYVDHGINGILVGRRPGELRHALRELAASPEYLGGMAGRAWSDSAKWTTEAAIMTWVEAWNSR